MSIASPSIFASQTHLKRFWPIENRIQAYNSATQNLANSLKQNPKLKQFSVKDYCFVIIERFVNGQWVDQIYYVPKQQGLQSLYKRITGDSQTAYFFYTPRTQKLVMMNTQFQEIYENYRDPDDNFIYLGMKEMNAFGGQIQGTTQ